MPTCSFCARRGEMQPSLPPMEPSGSDVGAVVEDPSKPIERTKTGIVLLIFAVLLQWIPVIQYLGLALGAIAAILIILGSPAFGRRHEGLVWISVVLFVAAQIAEFALLVAFASTVGGLPGNTSVPAAASTVLAAFDALVGGSLVAVSLVSVSFALIAFDLEDDAGRLLLVAGVAAQILVSVALFVLVLKPLIHQAVTEAFASTPVDTQPLVTAAAQIRGLSGLAVLNNIPALLFAGGYVWAHDRLSRGAVPPSPRAPAPASLRLRVAIVALLVLVSAGEVGAIASGALPVTPRPPPSWQQAAAFSGTGPETTADFMITGTSFQFSTVVTDNGPGGFNFQFTIYRAGTTDSIGSCGSGGGPGTTSSGCAGFSGAGSYYIVVTNASGVSSWTITVSQLV